jgi:hypothetical protein
VYLAINGLEIGAYPAEFKASIMDLDNSETTTRTASGKLSRDRIAVKRQIEMTFGALQWPELSAVLSAMTAEFFSFTYPDPLAGTQQTKTFYVGDRQAAVAIYKNGTYWWTGLQMTLTEQ